MTEPRITTAWNMIGLVEPDETVRIVGGRTLYEQVAFNDSTRGEKCRLDRLAVGRRGLRVISRYVDPHTLLEVVPDA